MFFSLRGGVSLERGVMWGNLWGCLGRQSYKNMRHMQIMPKTAPIVGWENISLLILWCVKKNKIFYLFSLSKFIERESGASNRKIERKTDRWNKTAGRASPLRTRRIQINCERNDIFNRFWPRTTHLTTDLDFPSGWQLTSWHTVHSRAYTCSQCVLGVFQNMQIDPIYIQSETQIERERMRWRMLRNECRQRCFESIWRKVEMESKGEQYRKRKFIEMRSEPSNFDFLSVRHLRM